MKRSISLLATALIALLLGSSTAHAIATEQPGQADILGDDTGCPSDWCGYLENPDLTFVSYAIGRYTSGALCTATWIGPNIVLTAGHCGPGPSTITSYFYRNGQRHPAAYTTTGCDYLVQNIQDDTNANQTGATDTALLYCPDIALGLGNTMPPGLLFGYLDFDARDVTIGEEIYKIWWNPVYGPAPDFKGQDHLLYSQGVVTGNTTPYGWPSHNQGFNRVDLNLCFNAGASGSVSISPLNHRIVVGAQSTGTALIGDPCLQGGFAAGAKAIFETWALDVIPYPIHFNPTLIQQLGLHPADYDGLQDKDKDYLFDVQTDLEAVQGEKVRNHYWLGFESERRNVQWRHNPVSGKVTWYPHDLFVNLQHAGSQRDPVLHHPTLWLKPSVDYRASVMVWTNAADQDAELVLELHDAPSPQLLSTAKVPTVQGGAWEMSAFHLRTGPTSSQVELVITARGNLDVSLMALSLIEEGSIMDFDTHDKRANWRNDMTGARALMLPEGKAGLPGREAAPLQGWSWAGLVIDSGTQDPIQWTLHNRQIAIVPDQQYRVCFDAKLYAGSTGRVYARVKDGGPNGAVYVQTSAAGSQSWQTICLPNLLAKNGNNLLQFGIEAGGNPVLIDDVTIDNALSPALIMTVLDVLH